MYPEYKANRKETPQLVIDALEPLMELCKAMNIPTLMLKGFEADDVIGSMAKRCAGEGLDVFMVTPDKDYGQLIEPHIWQYKPGKAGNDNEIIGVKEICEKYGISVSNACMRLVRSVLFSLSALVNTIKNGSSDSTKKSIICKSSLEGA